MKLVITDIWDDPATLHELEAGEYEARIVKVFTNVQADSVQVSRVWEIIILPQPI